ncbi:MAG: hypothetical protein KF774_19725 [Planctomyces sp.]|nr:hypothetical protein [Planctomyces sp.]
MPWPAWLKRAFAVDEGPLDPTPEQVAIVDYLAREVVRRGMTVPALAFLEMTQPLNYVSAQAIRFFAPLASAVFDARTQESFAAFLEHRGSMEFLCRAIERESSRAAAASANGPPPDRDAGTASDPPSDASRSAV